MLVVVCVEEKCSSSSSSSCWLEGGGGGKGGGREVGHRKLVTPFAKSCEIGLCREPALPVCALAGCRTEFGAVSKEPAGRKLSSSK